MKHPSLRIFFLLLALVSVLRAADSKESFTYVIVHGATAGGWEWKKTGRFLADDGHEVHRVTLTGLGERNHLASEKVDLDTHINDVVNVILFEDLHDVVLAGHSYGGMVITGVMNRIPDRIRHVIFLDAAVPNDGESMFDLVGGPPKGALIEDGLVRFPGFNPDAPLPHGVPHPVNTFRQPVAYVNPPALALPVSYVAFLPKGQSAEERAGRDKGWQRAVARGWTVRTFTGGHVAQQEDPRGVATLMEDAVQDRNKPIENTSRVPRRAPLLSPEVRADRRVTFRFHAPGAKEVRLSGQFLKDNPPMTRDDAGLWSITVGPVEPDLYPYNFIVDGVGVSDPANPDVFPNEGFKPSLVDIPGSDPALHSVQAVPHGEINYGFYQSKTLDRTRPVVVYTPPGYRAGVDKYPVLYLVSGTTDTEETWFKVGRANFILDNLIARNKALPMVVVMPYGNMMGGTPMPSSPEAAKMYQVFNDELIKDIIPYVETNYRVIPEREKRAIAGFSRGGGQALFTAFNNPDQFAWVGSYSAYLTPEVCDGHFPDLFKNPDAENPRFKLLWLGVGKEDFLYEPAILFHGFLDERKFRHETRITGGGHTWMNARQYLTETLQLYFK